MQRATRIRGPGRAGARAPERVARAAPPVAVRRTGGVRAARVGSEGIASADRFAADAMTAAAVLGAGALLLVGTGAAAAVAGWLLASQAALALLRQGRIGLSRAHQGVVTDAVIAVGLLGLAVLVLAAGGGFAGAGVAAWLAAGAAVTAGARSHRLLAWTLPALLVGAMAWLHAPVIAVLAGAAVVAVLRGPRRDNGPRDGLELLAWTARQGRRLLASLALGGGLALIVIPSVPAQGAGRAEAAAALLLTTLVGFAARRGLWASLRAALWGSDDDAAGTALRVRSRLLRFALASALPAAAVVAVGLAWSAVWAPFALLGLVLAVAATAVALGASEAAAWALLAAGVAVAAGLAPELAMAGAGAALVAVVRVLAGDLPRLGLQVRPLGPSRRRRA